jgi:hypothetical protein
VVECRERITESTLIKGFTGIKNVRLIKKKTKKHKLVPICHLALTIFVSSAALECLATLLKTKSILLSDVLRTNDIYDQLFRQVKYHGNTTPLAQARVSLFRCIESLIQGVGFGQPMPQVHEAVGKIFKYWASCSERSLQVKSAAARCLSIWIPYAASSYAAIGNAQSIIFKEITSSSTFGHVYGCLLYTALKESCSKEAVQLATNLPPSKSGSPPHDSAGILGYKEYESFEAIMAHIQSLWLKMGGKREARESLAAGIVSFFSLISFQYIEKKLSTILGLLFSLVSQPNIKLYGVSELDEAKSSISYILHSGIISNCTEDGKRLVFKELLSLLEPLASEEQHLESNGLTDLSRTSMILAEIYSLFAELGESIVPIVSSSGSGATVEEVLMKLVSQQQSAISSPAHRKVFTSHSQSPNMDGNLIWLWTGLVLKRYCAVNDQFFINVDRILGLLPEPVGKGAANLDPLPAIWAYANTKRTRPASSAEFGAMLNIAQALIGGPTNMSNMAPNAGSPNASNWNIAGWILLSSLLLRGSGQSAEQDRASMVSSHLATLQQLWKQELIKRPTNEADLADFASSKLWLLYSLKHFLANFSRLVHESNMTTFTTQCLNTVLKFVTSWQGTNSSPKSERDCAVIDALIIALLQSYTTLATHIFNPPPSMSPRQQQQQLSGSTDNAGGTSASFPARSVLQMIAKQMVRPRYVAHSWMARKYLHIEDESLDFNVSPNAGTLPSSSSLYTDLHACTSSIGHASTLLWSEWSNSLLQSRTSGQKSNGGFASGSNDSLQANLAAQLSTTQTETASVYLSPPLLLMSEMASLFPPLFHQQQESHQLQLLQYLGSCLASNTSQSAPVHANVIYFLLAIAKENAKLSGTHQLGTLLASSPSSMQNKPLTKSLLQQIVSIVEPYISSPSSNLRRLAAETMSHAVDADESGLLGPTIKGFHHSLWTACGYNNSTPASQIPPPTNSLTHLIKNEHLVEGSMLALGTIHRVVGGIRSRQFMSETIKVLTAIVKITFETRPPTTSSTPASIQHVTLNRTALHSLWIALEATGLTDTSFATSTLSTMLDGLISDASREWQTISHMGRIVGSIAAVLGPELQGSVVLLRRLQGAIILLDCVGNIEVEDMSVSFNSSSPQPLGTDWVPPRSLAPVCLAYTASTVLRERLLLFAPQFIDARRSSAKLLHYVRSMRRNTDFDDGSRDSALWSPVSFMRLNALRVLRFLAQLNPQAFQNDGFVRQIVLCPDRESIDSAVQSEMRVLIGTLEETLVPLDPLKWLAYASHFVMGAESDIKLDISTPSTSPSTPSTAKAAAAAAAAASTSTQPSAKTATTITAATATATAALKSSSNRFMANDGDENDEGEPMDETEEEMAGINSLSAPIVERISAAEDGLVWTLSSSLTALFVSSLHYVFEPLKSQAAHFDAALATKLRAQQMKSGAPAPILLLDSLPGIVSLASKASSASVAILQIAGLEAVHDILERFAETADVQLEGHFLLELYVAQMSAALRRCIARDSPVANRVGHVSYIVLAEMILWIAKHVSDVAALRQLLRPFLDYNLERRPLHAQSIGGAAPDYESDSPISLELNPRYVAWLMASALLWEGSQSLTPHVPGSTQTARSADPTQTSVGIAYLHESSNDHRLRRALCGGWLAILEYRAVQQYHQDLTQLTLFGSSSHGAGLKNDILGQTASLGINWCHVLIAMTTQYAEHVWSSLEAVSAVSPAGDSSPADRTAVTRSELSRSAHIMFGLILHNLSNATHISLSLKALELLMRGLTKLDQEAISPASLNLLPLPITAITELSQALSNLLGVIHYRDYTQKAQLLNATSETVVYLGLHNRLSPSDSFSTTSPAITSSFFKEDLGSTPNQILLKEILIESMEHGANCVPSTRHSATYLTAVLRNLHKSWAVLAPSDSQHAELALWLSKLVRLSTPDLPAQIVSSQLVLLILDCWEVIAASSPQTCCTLIKYALQQAESLKKRGEWTTDDVNESTFLCNALLRCVSRLPLAEDDSFAPIASAALGELMTNDMAKHSNGISILRVFIQKGLAGGDTELPTSILSVLVPELYQQISADSKVNISNISKPELEARQELLKMTVLLQNAPGLKEMPETFGLVIAALIRLLSTSPLPNGSPYSLIHDSSLTVLLHLAQTNPDSFKGSFAGLDQSEKSIFETAVRAHVEKQQAQQVAASAGKVKFSLDTSQYTK